MNYTHMIMTQMIFVVHNKSFDNTSNDDFDITDNADYGLSAYTVDSPATIVSPPMSRGKRYFSNLSLCANGSPFKSVTLQIHTRAI